MSEKESLLVDVINILQENLDCYVQAPSLDDEAIFAIMQPTELDYYKKIQLTNDNKQILMDGIKKRSVDEYFQSVEIRTGDRLLFEGYDGVEYGTISGSIQLPNWFINKHVTGGMCSVSEQW